MTRFFPEGTLLDTIENRAALHSPLSISDACAKKQILEAKVSLCDSEHNLIVDLGCMKGFIPRTEGALGISDGSVRDIAIISRVGKPVCFTVTALTTDENNRPMAILSRREAQKQCFDAYITTLSPGMIINATVTHLEPFGAFCDIGCGIASLLPIDSISISRIFHPRDRFKTGDKIKVAVKVAEAGRITLSQKELLGTWEQNAALFSAGETVSGIVRSIEDYGIFIELTPNLAGLAELKEGVVPGQRTSAYIKSIIPAKMKIKLIVIDSFEDTMQPDPLRYFYTEDYIDRFIYSPCDSTKQIETIF